MFDVFTVKNLSTLENALFPEETNENIDATLTSVCKSMKVQPGGD